MSGHYYNDYLYPLQDRVLKCIGKLDTPFYLTGGTVVGRYLLNHRYSDDLDFFVNANSNFVEETNHVITQLRSVFKEVRINNIQESFARVFVVEGDINLKLEFVNDVKFRVGVPSRSASGFFIDIWENILSNKVTALSRVAPKDFVDILFLSFSFDYNWKEIIDFAKMKDAWINEINVSQFLTNFDVATLDKVNFTETIDIQAISKSLYNTMARESLHGFNNSLYGKKI